MTGITIFVHFHNRFGSNVYDWNLYVNQPHLRINAMKGHAPNQIRFGNHYIGSELGLQAAKNKAIKALAAFFFKILMGNVHGSPEQPGWDPIVGWKGHK
jgi:hypothetical protein